MKPLLSIKVTRDYRPRDWIASGDHLTDEGRVAFADRLKSYAQVKPTAQAQIRQIRK